MIAAHRIPAFARSMRARLAAGIIAAATLALAFPDPEVRARQPSPPELTAPVNDFANVLSEAQEAELDSLSRKLQAASGDVVVVATIKSFEPYADLESYANRMFENHGKGIGQKGRDNGLLLVLAIDNREVRAEVGYDLEGIITDGYAGQTSREVMVPYFRNGDYGGGLVAGATRFAQRIAQARGVTLDGVPSAPVANDDGGGIPIVFVIFLVIIFINIVRGALNAMGIGRRRRRRGWTSGVGPFGAGYGGWSGGGWRGGGGWGGGGGFGGGFGGFGGGRSGGGGGGASW